MMVTFAEAYFRQERERNALAAKFLEEAAAKFEAEGKPEHVQQTRVMLTAVKEISAILDDALKNRKMTPAQAAQLQEEGRVAQAASDAIQALE